MQTNPPRLCMGGYDVFTVRHCTGDGQGTYYRDFNMGVEGGIVDLLSALLGRTAMICKQSIPYVFHQSHCHVTCVPMSKHSIKSMFAPYEHGAVDAPHPALRSEPSPPSAPDYQNHSAGRTPYQPQCCHYTGHYKKSIGLIVLDMCTLKRPWHFTTDLVCFESAVRPAEERPRVAPPSRGHSFSSALHAADREQRLDRIVTVRLALNLI